MKLFWHARKTKRASNLGRIVFGVLRDQQDGEFIAIHSTHRAAVMEAQHWMHKAHVPFVVIPLAPAHFPQQEVRSNGFQ